MVGHGGRSAGSYLADATSPIPSHCASVVATSTVRVNLVCNKQIMPYLQGLWVQQTWFWAECRLGGIQTELQPQTTDVQRPAPPGCLRWSVTRDTILKKLMTHCNTSWHTTFDILWHEKKATINQLTTMLSTSKKSWWGSGPGGGPGHNHLLTTGADDQRP